MIRDQRLIHFKIVVLCLLTLAMNAEAVNINVEGLFKNKAVLLIDGKRRVVQVGQQSPEGIKLIAINGEQVTLSVNGKRQQLKLGEFEALTTRFVKPKMAEVTISRNGSGMYSTVGSINGIPVNFLVDTGASVVTMNQHHAKRLGIDVKREGKLTIVNTASSVEQAYQVTLKKVAIGGIEYNNIRAVVMSGPHPLQILLGMSFLGRVEITRDGNMMRLRKKY